MLRAFAFLAALLFSTYEAIGADAIVGRASVIDGDTFEIHGARIRLYGIDAPETDQTCTVQRKTTRCGQHAALAVADKIGSRPVTCEPKDRDRYNRVVAICRVGGEDLNGWMVSQGWALAYRQYSVDYVPQEENAAAAKLGIWEGEFVAPWNWRSSKRLEATEAQRREPRRPNAQVRESCLIKGNISSRGERIYHVPGGQFYDRTRIDASKGERWFCSEQEARAAGWRRSLR